MQQSYGPWLMSEFHFGFFIIIFFSYSSFQLLICLSALIALQRAIVRSSDSSSFFRFWKFSFIVYIVSVICDLVHNVETILYLRYLPITI